jgi:hypothetical protein
VKEAALAPFTGEYRRHQEPVAAPQLTASVAPVQAAPEMALAAAPQAVPAKPTVAAKRIKPPRSPVAVVAAVNPKTDTAIAEPGQRGFFGFRRAQTQRVALRGNQSGFAGMINRAFGGR